MKKFALITGASGGIGRAIAEKLAAEGYSLYLHYHENEAAIMELLAVLKGYQGEYIPIQADLSSPDGYKRIADNIFSIDAIIHNSGISHYSLLVDTDNETIEKMMALHVTSPIYLTKELLPKMLRQQRGNILFITSIWGQTGSACEVVYSTVKGAQIAFIKSLAKELAMNGIRVNGIAPGAVNTSMMADFSEEELDMIKSGIPMGRMAEPVDVAESVSFLLNDKAGYITGHILNVNGGWYT
ncbi:elongation factor P 5-aminopentanone reductase [Bacillus benzoevorans]|uniref:3-oxoacyl-[acyl-carrier protein] reductase n=1 Tax=Bacillus benzoevorans TaxID=1456 RepID=A0A7X0LTS7_9BACI|nr:SDR family oxidoreductase [Bacillus benzoevorans]MBB6444206.1 3-oxoacyl-[acyl-carrier protein] reductase [Bacillus benzoevorans]